MTTHDVLDTEPGTLPAGRAAARWRDTSAGAFDEIAPERAPEPGSTPGRVATPEQEPTTPAAGMFDVTVMMVDDEPMMTDVVRAYLEDAGYRHFIAVNDPQLALATARARRPGMLLLDLMMPGISGFEILEQMRADEALRYVPVIMLTAASTATAKLRALELGATEFLSKPVDPSELVLRVRNSLVFKVYQDRLANEDALTRLPNRRVFVEQLSAALARRRGGSERLALLHVSLDRFRQINDSLGRAAGDRLLASVAERLRACARRSRQVDGPHVEPPLLARLGGDEFGLLLPRIDAPAAAERVARRVLAAMSPPFEHGGAELFVTPSIGIAVSPDDGDDDESMLRGAAAAATHAKRSGRNTYHFYSQALHTVSIERLGLETQLNRAIELGQLDLVYQPKVEIASGRIVGAEALLRWNHPVLGVVSPDRFVPIAEETGLIVGIGGWVIDRACAQAAHWRTIGLGPLKIAVNVSRHQMMAGGLVETVGAALERHRLPPGSLVIELTESLLMDRIDETTRQLDQLRALGALISIDDFGTGYSSMAYLKHFRLHELKIDKTFIAGTPGDATDCAIVRAITVLAASLQMQVVAEGVENAAQRDFLATIGCAVYQGYLCSAPIAPADFERKLREHV